MSFGERLNMQTKNGPLFQDLTGRVFGRLTVTGTRRKHSEGKQTITVCDVVCECGTAKTVAANNLKNGNAKSCGCLDREKIALRTKHGLSGTPIYQVWIGMRLRCGNPQHRQYSDYGGRGITVCDEWKDSLDAFVRWANENGYREGLQIDRADNSRGYSPDNCRFVTCVENNNNKRSNVRIEFRGESKTLIEWSRALGINYQTLFNRVNRGWSIERALTMKVARK